MKFVGVTQVSESVRKNDGTQESEDAEITEMEGKILNTLWTHQVNLAPDFSQQWTFRIHANTPIFLSFREAANRLIGRGWVSETDIGQIHLTAAGFRYCKANYESFPMADFFPDDPINPVKLQEAISTVAPSA